MAFTYDENIYSDLHKDVYGSRPGNFGWARWAAMTQAEKQAEWDYLIEENDRQIAQEERWAEEAFDIVLTSAPDAETARRWLQEAEEI